VCVCVCIHVYIYKHIRLWLTICRRSVCVCACANTYTCIFLNLRASALYATSINVHMSVSKMPSETRCSEGFDLCHLTVHPSVEPKAAMHQKTHAQLMLHTQTRSTEHIAKPQTAPWRHETHEHAYICMYVKTQIYVYVYVLKEITLMPSGAAKKSCMSRVFCIESLSFWSELADSTLVILLTHISGAFSL